MRPTIYSFLLTHVLLFPLGKIMKALDKKGMNKKNSYPCLFIQKDT